MLSRGPLGKASTCPPWLRPNEASDTSNRQRTGKAQPPGQSKTAWGSSTPPPKNTGRKEHTKTRVGAGRSLGLRQGVAAHDHRVRRPAPSWPHSQDHWAFAKGRGSGLRITGPPFWGPPYWARTRVHSRFSTPAQLRPGQRNSPDFLEIPRPHSRPPPSPFIWAHRNTPHPTEPELTHRQASAKARRSARAGGSKSSGVGNQVKAAPLRGNRLRRGA